MPITYSILQDIVVTDLFSYFRSTLVILQCTRQDAAHGVTFTEKDKLKVTEDARGL